MTCTLKRASLFIYDLFDNRKYDLIVNIENGQRDPMVGGRALLGVGERGRTAHQDVLFKIVCRFKVYFENHGRMCVGTGYAFIRKE